MFYCLDVFSEDIYFLEDENAIVLFKIEAGCLHVFDIISQEEIDLARIINKIARPENNKVVFHFTPEYDGVYMSKESLHSSNMLFVRWNHGEIPFPEHFKHPITSLA
ncbi:hypothetical protein [Peribacillus glennii]|uniref:Uncharacterized protein n=1 Tax=Peribacillus glennii TaxID=2303991 RepID=A0A372LAK9_9BACI|nr:hypothetical protein [Peribacillus glennii]RFU62831.1 hypothetical protein D0466_12800 [Peribacillus glennii]